MSDRIYCAIFVVLEGFEYDFCASWINQHNLDSGVLFFKSKGRGKIPHDRCQFSVGSRLQGFSGYESWPVRRLSDVGVTTKLWIRRPIQSLWQIQSISQQTVACRHPWFYPRVMIRQSCRVSAGGLGAESNISPNRGQHKKTQASEQPRTDVILKLIQ